MRSAQQVVRFPTSAVELRVTLVNEAPTQLNLTSFRLFDHVTAWKPVGDHDQGGAACLIRKALQSSSSSVTIGPMSMTNRSTSSWIVCASSPLIGSQTRANFGFNEAASKTLYRR